MSNLSNAIEQFHVFSKTPVSSSLGLGQAVNRGGHTVSLSDVLGDDLPFFSKDQFLSMADAKNALNGVARENDIIQVGNEIVKRVNGSWTSITLNDGDTLQNKDGSDVLLYHKGVRLEAVTAGNNSGTSSQGDSKGGKECYFAGRIRKAGENGELVQFFIGVNDKILAGLPSLGYKPTLEVESETTTEIIQAEGTDYWINPYAGIVVFEAARPISSASVHKNDELCIKISCFEYIGKMADSTKQEKLKYVNETNTSLELGGNGITISVKGPLSFNEGGAFISNQEMIQIGGRENPYLELQALNDGGRVGIIAIDTDTIFINGPLHLAYDANTTFNGDWLYKYGSDLYWGASKITNQSGTVYTEGSGISLFNNQISIKRSGGDNSGLSFDLQGGIKVDFSYAEKYFSWITTGPSSMNISSPSLTLGQFDSTSYIKISDNTISFNGPRIVLGSDPSSIVIHNEGMNLLNSALFIGPTLTEINNALVKFGFDSLATSVTFNGPVAINDNIHFSTLTAKPQQSDQSLYNVNGDLYWSDTKLNGGGSTFNFIREESDSLYLGSPAEDVTVSGSRSVLIQGPNNSFIRLADYGIMIDTNQSDQLGLIVLNGQDDAKIVMSKDGIKLGMDNSTATVTINGPTILSSISGVVIKGSSFTPESTIDNLYNWNGDLYWNGSKLNNQGSSNYLFYSPLFKGPSNEITLELADDSNLKLDEIGRLKVNSSAFASIENFNSLENRVLTLETDLNGVAVKFNSQNNDSNNVLQGALFNIQENGSIISINSEADLSDTLLQSNAVIEVHVKSEQTPFNITWNEAWKWSGTPLETTEENTYYIIQIRHDAWNNIVCKVTHQYN